MRTLKAAKQSYAKIADALNATLDKHPTRTGKPWSKQMVFNVLDRMATDQVKAARSV